MARNPNSKDGTPPTPKKMDLAYTRAKDGTTSTGSVTGGSSQGQHGVGPKPTVIRGDNGPDGSSGGTVIKSPKLPTAAKPGKHGKVI